MASLMSMHYVRPSTSISPLASPAAAPFHVPPSRARSSLRRRINSFPNPAFFLLIIGTKFCPNASAISTGFVGGAGCKGG